MLKFDDTQYQYFPPKLNKFLVSIFRYWNRFIYLPGKEHRIKSVTVTNTNILDQIKKTKCGQILFLPNHCTHSDPQVMMEVGRQTNVYSQFMAAYDVFNRSKFRSWIMQRSGAFSVDRLGSDSKSMKEAIKTLVEGNYALTIFPEGNVYFTNDKVTPFLEGAAYIAMKAQKELGDKATIYVVPTSLKYTHLFDQKETIIQMLQILAKEAGIEIREKENIITEIKRIGIALLIKNLKKHGYSPLQIDQIDVLSFIAKNAKLIIRQLEEKMDLKTDDEVTLMDRIAKINRTIHQIIINPDKRQTYPDILAWSNEAMLAFRILTYSGSYLDDYPSIDRFGESVEKLLEDTYSKAILPYGDRAAYIHFSQPIPLSAYLEKFKTSSRETLQELTVKIEKSVQEGLDLLNKNNPHPGGQLFN